MVCQNNPCPEYLPKVGDASPIVGDEDNTSNMNLVAAHFSGGRRHRRRTARKVKKAGSRRRYRRHTSRKVKKGGAFGDYVLDGGRRRRSTRKSRRSHRKMKKGGELTAAQDMELI